ncbi:MAG: prepilin peptidase, partial [Promethearchaeota archaeon]
MFFLINFCLISLILLISVYLDLKFRIVSKFFFLGYFILMFILNTYEYVLFFSSFQIFFSMKLFILMILLFSSFLLFTLKIFGGSDGKLVIIIFIIHP